MLFDTQATETLPSTLKPVVVGVAQDVTETILNDRALAAAASDLRLLINTANAPIFGIDTLGNVNIWNEKTVELTGYLREEAVGKPLNIFFEEEDITSTFEKTLKGENFDNYQVQFTSRNGNRRHLLINFSCRRDENSAITGALAVSQDVTENALRDLAVASMANELRQLIDTANAPIFGIDSLGTVNEWNNKTAEITGYSREEAIGKPLTTTFIVQKLRDSVQRVMDLALQGNETSNYELEFTTKVRNLMSYVQHPVLFKKSFVLTNNCVYSMEFLILVK